MKAVLIGIRPEWCEKIASGEKTLEVRKNRPKLETPFKCYIYCTKSAGRFAIPNADGKPVESAGKVIAEFVCDRIDRVYIPYSHKELLDEKYIRESCVSYSDLMDTFLDDYACFWHVSNLRTYGEPKELNAFTALRKTKFGYEPNQIERAPQSWCYVCEDGC